MTKYAISEDGERYNGDFDSIEDACDQAVADYEEEGFVFWVGEKTPPPQPETWWKAEPWLAQSDDQDEYGMDCADRWNRSTPAQRRELEAEVRVVLAAWLDRHGLRPLFSLIEKDREFVIVKGADGELTYEPVEVVK